eukprot:scaffold1053_cov107-Isochrysis_galbana.AAC.20
MACQPTPTDFLNTTTTADAPGQELRARAFAKHARGRVAELDTGHGPMGLQIAHLTWSPTLDDRHGHSIWAQVTDQGFSTGISTGQQGDETGVGRAVGPASQRL